MVKHKKINFLIGRKIFKEIILEIFFGFFMAITTFEILPIAIENSGFIITFFGILTGIFLFFILRRFIKEKRSLWMMFCVMILLCYRLVGLLISKYSVNGIFLGIMAGMLLFVQILYLSEKNCSDRQPKYLDFMYLSGLLLGILLK